MKKRNKDIKQTKTENNIKKKREESNDTLYEYYNHEMDRLWVEEEVKIKQLQRLIRDI